MLIFSILETCLYFVAGKCFDTYVVQTDDDNLHFIAQTIQTHKLHLDPIVTVDGEDSELHKTETGIIDQFRTQVGLPTVNEANLVLLTSRIDRIYVSTDGIINFFDKRLFIDELLVHPFIEDGIYISASQEHNPSIINKTLIITATTKISILDIVNFSSRVITFSQILYLHEIFRDIPKKETEIYLNDKWWRFDSAIVAVYVLKENNGLNFMLRVFDKSAVAIYKHRVHKPASKKPIVIIVLSFVLLVIMFLNRNLRIKYQIIKHRLYTGKFVKKDCLIYEINNSFLRDYRRSFGSLKLNSLVNILSDSEGWMQPLIVTEATSQFIPSRVENINLYDYEGLDALKIIEKIRDKDYLEPTKQFKTDVLSIIQCLQEIHSYGIVHGRICPENVRVSADGHIKLQCLLDEDGWKSFRQLKNNKNYKLNEVDDIFSLGCLIHYYMTGYHPYDLRNYTKKERRGYKRERDNNGIAIHNTDSSEAMGSLADIPFVDNGMDECNSGNHSGRNVNLKRDHWGLKCKRFIESIFRSFVSWLYSFFVLNLLKILSYMGNLFVKIWPVSALLRLARYTCQGVTKLLNMTLGRFFRREQPPVVNKIYKKVLSDEISKYIEYNILYGTYRIRVDDQIEHDLIYHCLKSSANDTRPKMLCHPYFWDNHKYLEFICDISDFIETNSGIKPRLERSRRIVFTGSWMDYLDISIVASASTKRVYDGQSFCDLIRLIRNCHRHYQELKGKILEQIEGNLFFYLSALFPELLMFLYRNPVFREQAGFKKYYE